MPRPLHPEHREALEVELDRLSPAPAPTLTFDSSTADPRQTVVTAPASERHRLYVGRLVRVAGACGAEREGFIEEIGDVTLVVRLLY